MTSSGIAATTPQPSSTQTGGPDRVRRNLAVPIGVLLVVVAILIAGEVVEGTLFPRGTIVGTARRATALWLMRIALFASGIYLMLRRPRLTIIELTGFGL